MSRPFPVADDVLGEIATIPSLAGDATAGFTKTTTVPASTDAVDNEVTACGLDPPRNEFCDTDIHHLTVIHPAITIDKKVSGDDHKPESDALKAHEGDDLACLLLWIAFATTLIAAGLAMMQTQRRSPSA